MWPKDEMIEVIPPALPGSYGATRVGKNGGGGALVQGMTMDALIDRSGFERVDLLKMDVEGAEAGMFATGSDWLRRVRSLAVEFHGDARTDCDFDRIVAGHGMKITELGNNGAFAEWP